MSFESKVVIVTGASSGISAATAIEFSKEGANVVIVGRNEEKLNNVLEECTKVGKKPLSIIADVSKEENLEKIVKETTESFGKIDVLVNNAGMGRFTDILDSNILNKWDEVMNTNLRAQVYLTHLATPFLIKSKGNIINISSVASKTVGHSLSLVYGTSKAALTYLTRSVAANLASHGVRVNSVSPGPVETDIMKNAGVDKPISELIPTPLGRISEPVEVADIILYLASDKAKAVTGADFVIDNGLLLSN